MNDLEFSHKSLTKNTYEMTIKYGDDEFAILDDKKNIKKLHNVLAHLETKAHSAETELEILKNKPMISKGQQEIIEMARNALDSLINEDITVTYDNVESDRHIYSFQEFVTKYGYIDSDISARSIDIRNQYFDFCKENNYDSEDIRRMPIDFLRDHFGTENFRTATNYYNSMYVYHIGFSYYNVIDVKKVEYSALDTIDKNVLKGIIMSDDLNIVTVEEFCAYCKQEGFLCPKYTKQSNKKWFKNIVDNVYHRPYSNNYGPTYTFGKLPDEIDLKYIKSKAIKAKIVVDKNGGIEFLYNAAKTNLSPSNLSKILKLKDLHLGYNTLISYYLRMYGFNGWTDFNQFVQNYDSWEACKKAIIAKIHTNLEKL